MQSSPIKPGPTIFYFVVATIPACFVALMICDFLLRGVTVDTFGSYVFAAVTLSLPTLFWLIAVIPFLEIFVSESADFGMYRWQVTGMMLGAVLIFVVVVCPLLLMTSLPGVLVADWLTPGLAITGGWTYLWTCLITTTVLACCRQLQPWTILHHMIRNPSR